MGLSMSADQQANRPPARIEIQQQDASAPVPRESCEMPDAQQEDVQDDWVLMELSVSEDASVEDPMTLQPVHDRVLSSPSDVMQLASLERVVQVSPEVMAEIPLRVDPKKVVDASQQTQESAPQEFVEAQRSDNEAPKYPLKEKRLSREGRVLLRVVVSRSGVVEDVRLLEPSRYSGFNRAALDAARKWSFEPATCGGVAVASETDVEVVFQLTGD
jgi:TonB family protein